MIENESGENDKTVCPKCNSNNILIDKKGFNLKKGGVAGAIFLPAVLIGLHGKDDLQGHCIDCDNKWLLHKKETWWDKEEWRDLFKKQKK